MKFLLEEIDLTKIKQLYFLRGYEKEGDDHYCMSLVLLGDSDDEFTVSLLISRKTLSTKDWKELMKYAKKSGLKLHAETLKTDFDKFYNSRAFERIKV
jgi:hypothetical protein